MKKLLPFIFAVVTTPTYAEITAKYVTSAQISIDSPYVITNAAPSSYSISVEVTLPLLQEQEIVLSLMQLVD